MFCHEHADSSLLHCTSFWKPLPCENMRLPLLTAIQLNTSCYEYHSLTPHSPLLHSKSPQLLTGKGALSQFGYEVGLDTIQVDWFIVALIGFNAIAALLPTSGTFVPEEREALKERPKGALQDPKITIFEPKKFFGISEFGFTKANELFVGRVAQLGFAASLIGEVVTGKGPLAQFDFGE